MTKIATVYALIRACTIIRWIRVPSKFEVQIVKEKTNKKTLYFNTYSRGPNNCAVLIKRAGLLIHVISGTKVSVEQGFLFENKTFAEFMNIP